MKERPYVYRNYVEYLDLDAYEEAIGFDVLRVGQNQRGEPEDIGQCPDPWQLHKNGDTTGKFAISREKRVYNCFVCGGGTLLDLAMAVKGIDEQEAEEWLYQYAKPVEQSDEAFLDEIDALLAEHKKGQIETTYYNERVLDKWTANINDLGPWLDSRGISSEIAALARLGCQKDALRMAPIKSDKPREEAYEGPCVYLPHFWGTKLVGWQQRWLDEDRPKWIPKYTNTSGFPKATTIYNFENEFYADRPVIVVESVCTVLFLKSIGFPAVATFGGSVTDEQMRLLRYFQQGVVLAPDNDPPGDKWIGYTESEEINLNRGQKVDRVILAQYLARFIPVKVIDPIGNTGDDLGDLMAEGIRWARDAVEILYEGAHYYESPHR